MEEEYSTLCTGVQTGLSGLVGEGRKAALSKQQVSWDLKEKQEFTRSGGGGNIPNKENSVCQGAGLGGRCGMGSESQAGGKAGGPGTALSLTLSSLAGPPWHEPRLKMTEQCQKQGVPVRHNTPPAENWQLPTWAGHCLSSLHREETLLTSTDPPHLYTSQGAVHLNPGRTKGLTNMVMFTIKLFR